PPAGTRRPARPSCPSRPVPWGWPALPWPLLGLLMHLVPVAPRAVLFPLHAFGVLAPVLRREIVSAFADRALHDDVFPRHLTSNAEVGTRKSGRAGPRSAFLGPRYFKILVTTPAPTVRPPSRIAKRSPSSIAIGVISSIVIFVLSPGITISTPLANSTVPVTSVVRR